MPLLISELESKTSAACKSIDLALSEQGSACLTCSFQAEDMVVLHLVRERLPGIPVLFLETGYHFAEVYRYRDEMTARYKLNLMNVIPEQTVPEQESQFGVLYQSRPDECCQLRKVRPLFAALQSYEIWFTGLRRVQSPTRASLKALDGFPLPSGKRLLKVSPLADWLDKDVWEFARDHGIPLLPLYAKGYTSIGCQPCTELPADAANPRSGRWTGRKLECGIHIAQPH
ncbi:MAG: phosphoadenylyl-sulfate reductase [Bryobacteraceae bacterium]